ncbi:MAG: tetratricopeptide repeat protein [Ignavibacteriales bacterium]|nr:tetratricopeptide repeat protein [Ignavibacteriales bacterium]
MKKIITLFLLSIFLVNGCNPVNDKEMYDSAKKNLDDKKYNEAVGGFEKLAVENPESKFAAKGLLECARLYHNSIIPDIDKPVSLSKALGYYKRVFNNYPQDSTAELSLFLTGFIFSNDLGQMDSARTYYELFMKKYPKSQFANSVRLELDNLGLTPDEILEKKLKSNQ